MRNTPCADAELYIVTVEKLIWNFVNLSMQDLQYETRNSKTTSVRNHYKQRWQCSGLESLKWPYSAALGDS
jgi:hypothetical protein